MLAINGALMGLLALSFTRGPYSSTEQELWYRYGSLAFVLGGAVLPAVAVLFGINRWPWAIVALTVWMVATLLAFVGYAMFSGGGV
jgi:hypothetical protein